MTIKNVHGLLSAAMKTASILDYRDNPCRGVPSPKSTPTDDNMQQRRTQLQPWCASGLPVTRRFTVSPFVG
jgi:hypothetical protein